MTYRINAIAIAAAVVAAFIASGVWYGVLFGTTWVALAGLDAAATLPGPGEIAAQLIRELIVTSVLAQLMVMTRVKNWRGAVCLGLLLWVGFQAMAIVGSVIHEHYPWQLYLIHSGDALMKMVLVSTILICWPRRPATISQGA